MAAGSAERAARFDTHLLPQGARGVVLDPWRQKLLDSGREESDYATRRKIYNDFQKVLAETVPTIMMFSADLLAVERVAEGLAHDRPQTGDRFGAADL